jgi:hypothetical protein
LLCSFLGFYGVIWLFPPGCKREQGFACREAWGEA